MLKCVLFVAFVLLATCQIPTTDGASRSNGRASGYNSHGRYYGGQAPPAQPMSATQAAQPQTPKEYLDNKSGFSTFGIISIIFAVIVFCLAFYYGIMCYPFLCRSVDEKKYRFMDISSTITGATSGSIQSIENFSVDQKH